MPISQTRRDRTGIYVRVRPFRSKLKPRINQHHPAKTGKEIRSVKHLCTRHKKLINSLIRV